MLFLRPNNSGEIEKKSRHRVYPENPCSERELARYVKEYQDGVELCEREYNRTGICVYFLKYSALLSAPGVSSQDEQELKKT